MKLLEILELLVDWLLCFVFPGIMYYLFHIEAACYYLGCLACYLIMRIGATQRRFVTKQICEHSGVEWETVDFPMDTRMPYSSDGTYVISAWVSVKDKGHHPPNGETVLISDGQDVLPGFIDSDLEWRMHNTTELCEDVDFFITHWMLLPEPPK